MWCVHRCFRVVPVLIRHQYMQYRRGLNWASDNLTTYSVWNETPVEIHDKLGPGNLVFRARLRLYPGSRAVKQFLLAYDALVTSRGFTHALIKRPLVFCAEL
jgi:hypothetical protein